MNNEKAEPDSPLLYATTLVVCIGLIVHLRPENEPPNAWYGSMPAFEAWTTTLDLMLKSHYSIHIIPLVAYALYSFRDRPSPRELMVSCVKHLHHKIQQNLCRLLYTLLLVGLLEITQRTTSYLWLHIHSANANHIFFHKLIKTAAVTNLILALVLP